MGIFLSYIDIFAFRQSLYHVKLNAMENWQDQGIVLSIRPHGENGAIVSIMTSTRGRCAGYVRGARSTKLRGTLEPGNVVDAVWSSRVADGLGTYTLELSKSYAADIFQDPLKLCTLQSACALCDAALPEGESHDGLFHGLCALFDMLAQPIWAQAYVMWEIAFLKELGFSLDLSKCAGGGDANDLAYVSPKTGRAVSAAAGAPYKGKLLPLPDFLKPNIQTIDDHEIQGEILKGLTVTGYFLEHWVFNHHSHGVPEARRVLHARFEKISNAQK